MSLINQVLKDLEHRQVAEGGEGAAIMQHVRYVPAPRQRPHNWRMYSGMAVVIVLITSASSVYVWRSNLVEIAPLPLAANKPIQVAVTTAPSQVIVDTPTPVVAPSVAVAASIPSAPVATVTSPPIPASAKVRTKKTRDNSPVTPVAAPLPSPNDIEPDSNAVMHKQPVIRSASELAAVTYQQAYQLIGQQRWREAESQLRDALNVDAGQFRLRELLVGLYIKTGRWVEADAILAQGLKVVPLHQPLVKLRARTLMQLNQDRRALDVLTHAAPVLQNDPEHYALMAALQQRLGHHDQAAGLYRQLLAEHSNVGVWWVGLGISLDALHQQSEAQLAYRHARASGNLSVEVTRYTNNRLRALQELGLGTDN